MMKTKIYFDQNVGNANWEKPNAKTIPWTFASSLLTIELIFKAWARNKWQKGIKEVSVPKLTDMKTKKQIKKIASDYGFEVLISTH